MARARRRAARPAAPKSGAPRSWKSLEARPDVAGENASSRQFCRQTAGRQAAKRLGGEIAGKGNGHSPSISLGRASERTRPPDLTPNQSSPSQTSTSPERDEIVEQRPLDQRPEVAAHPHIRLEAVRRARFEAQRMLAVDRRPSRRHGCGTSSCGRPAALDAHLDGEKRRVVDLDPDALDRRHQHVALGVPAQDRGEQLHQRQRGRSASPGRTTFRRRRCACRCRRSTADSTDAPAPARVGAARASPRPRKRLVRRRGCSRRLLGRAP